MIAPGKEVKLPLTIFLDDLMDAEVFDPVARTSYGQTV